MKINLLKALVLSIAATLATLTPAMAATITHDAFPSDVPDEMEPRVNAGDAPSGFGSDSWQGPETGKSNWHARYLSDGDVLSTLFPAEAATMTLNDIASVSYYTNRPTGTPAGRDWWLQIYTRTGTGSDQASWYGHKYTNNYNDHTSNDVWTQHSTDAGMTFDGASITGELSLADLKNANSGDTGNELIEMFSVQTDSGWDGFDGYLDGLVITLTNGNIGQVNFQGAAVPEPTTLALAGLGLCGLATLRRRRKA